MACRKQDSTTLLCMSGIKIPVIILGANIQAGYKGIESWKVHQADVRAVCYDGLSGKINMVSGGPPCQPFSMGGKAQAYNDKRDMFPEAVRAVREIMPEVFIFENVKGLLRKNHSAYTSVILFCS